MRHRRRTRKLGMKTAHREAMFRNMVTSLFEHGRIMTTVPRAKELRRRADRLVTLAKRGDLHAVRQALSVIRSKDVVAKLFDEIAERFMDRSGGYVRIVKVGPRRGDGAMMAVVELAFDSLSPAKREEGGSKAHLSSEGAQDDIIPVASQDDSSSEGEEETPVSQPDDTGDAVEGEEAGADSVETATDGTDSVVDDEVTGDETEHRSEEPISDEEAGGQQEVTASSQDEVKEVEKDSVEEGVGGVDGVSSEDKVDNEEIDKGKADNKSEEKA